MDIQEQQEFGEVIREQGQNQGHCMKDLVFVLFQVISF